MDHINKYIITDHAFVSNTVLSRSQGKTRYYVAQRVIDYR
jgi:hypothetical protein